MRTIHVLLVLLSIPVLAILIGIGYVWYQIAFTEYEVGTPPQSEINAPDEETSGTQSEVRVIDPAAESVSPKSAASFVVDVAALPENQRKVLETFGITDSFAVTEGMVGCAIEALGEARVMELRVGSAPSLTEGLSLLSCSQR